MSERTPEAVLWDALRGAMVTKALGGVVDLGVPAALAEGPRPVTELADELGADPDVLHRILRALASDGIFAEEPPGVFGHTDASRLLCEGGWSEFAHLFGGVFYHAIDDLDPRRAEPSFEHTFGTDFWSWLRERPDERAIFDRAMAGGKERRVERLERVEWRGGDTVVDIGGGNGSLLVELVRRQPDLRGIVFDLPETERDEAELARHGIRFVPGSFFEAVPAAEVYVLGTVLHDWDDERAVAILRTIRASAPAGARVRILDAVVPPGNDRHGNKWLDLLMLTMGGRERTEREWEALLAAAGLAADAIEDGLIQASCP